MNAIIRAAPFIYLPDAVEYVRIQLNTNEYRGI